MVDFKLVMNDSKTGKSYNREVKDDAAAVFMNMRISDKVKGESFDMPGYEFEITGGSDKCGFPMRKDVNTARKKILAVSGVGVKKKGAGIRQRKTVCGSNINSDISQINLNIIKYGKAGLGEDAQKPAEENKEDKPAVEKKEEKPAQKKKEDKPAEEKREGKPAEEKAE